MISPHLTLFSIVFILLWLRMLVLSDFAGFESGNRNLTTNLRSRQLTKAPPLGKTQIKRPIPGQGKAFKSPGVHRGGGGGGGDGYWSM